MKPTEWLGRLVLAMVPKSTKQEEQQQQRTRTASQRIARRTTRRRQALRRLDLPGADQFDEAMGLGAFDRRNNEEGNEERGRADAHEQ